MNRAIFVKGMALLDEAFEHKTSEAQAEIYWRALSTLTDQEFEVAVWDHIKTCKWFPRASELLCHRKPDALAAWNRLIKSAEDGVVPVLNEMEQAAINALGGWDRFQFSSYDELLRHFGEFKAAFESGRKRDLRLIEGGK